MGKSKPNMRDLRLAAMAGEHSAARALLRLYGHNTVSGEIKRGKPFSNRVRRAVDMLTAGTGTRDHLGEWEIIGANGEIENDLQHDPPPRGKAPARDILIDD